MELTLLPLQNDDVLRVRSDGPVSRRDPSDPLQTLLGPNCYTHKVLLSLDRSQAIDTSGICWLVNSNKRFSQSGGKLILFGVPPVVLDVLNFLRLTSLLHIASNEQAACEMAVGAAGEPAGGDQPTTPAIRFPR
jgi:ABC-type transporter Mla MlaB component